MHMMPQTHAWHTRIETSWIDAAVITAVTEIIAATKWNNTTPLILWNDSQFTVKYFPLETTAKHFPKFIVNMATEFCGM